MTKANRALLAVVSALLTQTSYGGPVHGMGNPILTDGNFYSADPAPLGPSR